LRLRGVRGESNCEYGEQQRCYSANDGFHKGHLRGQLSVAGRLAVDH